MALSIEKIRQKLKEQQDKKENRSTGTDNAIYPFWNIPDGSSATLRFLPDGNSENDFFWEERLVIRLPFKGIKGQTDNEVQVTVPCLEMWKETCPILAETKPWWKDPELEGLARKYWKKKSYLFQGFVVSSSMEEKEKPANPIRRLVINPSIFEIIRTSLTDPDMEDLPVDYVSGRDFKLVKGTKGGYANYTTSSWSIRSRSLSEEERNAIDTYGLFNLRDFLPKKPSKEEVDVMVEMFHASVNEEAFDNDRFGKYFKPNGYMERSQESTQSVSSFMTSSAPAPSSVSAVSEESEEMVNTKTNIEAPLGAKDALAALKARTSNVSSLSNNSEVSDDTSKKQMSTDELLAIIRSRK